MNSFNLEDLEKNYDLQLEKILSEIKKSKAKLVLLQFADGLKPYAPKIVDWLEKKTGKKVEFLIWFGSCYGACDIPTGLEKLRPKINLVIQFGHNSLQPAH